MTNRCIIGINTGGTFTDGVLLDYASRKVISSGKSLTTREDLKIGVIKVLRKLDIQPHHKIQLAGISSTLATNTVAEGKARKTGLLLVGYDRDLVESYGLNRQLPADEVAYFSGGHNAQGESLAPLDEEGIRNWVREKGSEVEALAVSSYFSPLNPEHEEEVFRIISGSTSLPVVMAHQLSTRLDSIRRASTASINASLVAVMHDFILAVQQSLKELEIDAPLMIVRGDGTLMPSGEAARKPVETVMSGPAASAIGGRFLAGNGNCLVVDMGSTTTDMAVVHNNRVMVSETGAKVGETQTAVEAAKIRTISLGCDSRIHHNEKNQLVLGPDRVRPLAQIAIHHPHVREEILSLRHEDLVKKDPATLEYWYLHRPLDKDSYSALDDKQQGVIDRIRTPRQLAGLLAEMGVFHAAHLNVDHLVKEGKIECSSLTPSDLLHADRSVDMWDREVATVALEHYCRMYGEDPKSFTEEVFEKIVHKLTEEMIIFLASQKTDPDEMPAAVDGEWGKWMLHQILYSDNHFISIDADSRYPVVATGAPARHFLKKAARTLNARFVLPEYFEVANAVGAVSGLVSEIREVLVFVRENEEQYGYVARHEGATRVFQEYDECCDYAEEKASELAMEAASRSGATDCFLEVQRRTEGSLLRITARAIGNPKLSNKK